MPLIIPARWRSDAALLFAVLVWGVNMPILKAALAAMPIHVLNVVRFLISAGVMALLYGMRERRQGLRLGVFFRRYPRQIIALGLLGYVFYQYFFVSGVNLTTAGNAALIMAGAPLWTAIVGSAFGYERLSRRHWLALFVVLCGTLIIIFAGKHDFDFGSSTFKGNLMMLAASALWGSYTAFSRPVVARIPPIILAFLGILVALPVLALIAAPRYDEVVWAKVDLGVWLAILFSGGLSTGVTFVIWTTAVKNVGASQTAVFGNLVPFVALLSSAALLGERIFLAQLAGGAMIIGGLLLMRVRSPFAPRAAKTPAPGRTTPSPDPLPPRSAPETPPLTDPYA